MAKPLKCDVCDKPATVHLTQIINNQIHKIDLCESCAEQKGITDPSGYSLADLLVKPDEASSSQMDFDVLVCSECGCTQREFKKTGRLGCRACYEAFASMVNPALESMHRGVSHKGKVPRRALARKSFADELDQLETDLADAIGSERYEDAARLRDQIIELKKSATELVSED